MTSRLGQQYPDIAAGLRTLPLDEQVELGQRVALHAARSTDLSMPPEGADYTQWAAAVDSIGWTQDHNGDWTQAPGDFARARAASAVSHAFAVTSAPRIDESLYESIAALGPDPVRAELDLGTP